MDVDAEAGEGEELGEDKGVVVPVGDKVAVDMSPFS